MKLEDVREKYPDYFTEMRSTYFECDDGWAEIVMSLCDDLHESNFTGKFIYIKEKFASMRCAIHSATEEQYNRIHIAEQQSMRICEFCGGGGKYNNKTGWAKTLCDKCADEWVANHQKRLDKIKEDLSK